MTEETYVISCFHVRCPGGISEVLVIFKKEIVFKFIFGRVLQTLFRLQSLIADMFLQPETWQVHFCISLVSGYRMGTFR